MAELLKSLSSSSAFPRGLPTIGNLQDTSIADVFRDVLLTGSIVVDESFDQPSKVAKSPLQRCFEYGWLHNEVITPTQVAYTFASPLHKRYVQCMLLGNLEEATISESRIEDFVIAVIRRFIPLNLSAPRTIGAQSTPEAQFRDEFYRACMNHTKGCVLSFPEFGTQRGRIDFFIPLKKWGIELLCNGDRNDGGEYGQWIADQKMNDYRIVDFRTQRPRSGHKGEHSLRAAGSFWSTQWSVPGIDNILYVVSTDNWRTVDILDNKLVVVASSGLLCV